MTSVKKFIHLNNIIIEMLLTLEPQKTLNHSQSTITDKKSEHKI